MGSKEPRSERLTVDHKGSDPAECARVTQEGGTILRGRVFGQLMLTRALGDFAFKQGGGAAGGGGGKGGGGSGSGSGPVICKPYFQQRELKRDRDIAICLASDGFWDVADEEDVTAVVLTPQLSAQQVPAALCELAKNRGSADNITACVIYLN